MDIDEKALCDALTDWLLDLDEYDPPPGDIAALHFALTQGPVVREGIGLHNVGLDNSHQVVLTGSRSYDPGDDEWIYSEDYLPEFRVCPGFGVPEETEPRDALHIFVRLMGRVMGELRGIALLEVPVITAGGEDGAMVILKGGEDG